MLRAFSEVTLLNILELAYIFKENFETLSNNFLEEPDIYDVLCSN